MEQAANRLPLRELVVQRHSVLRRQYVHSDLPFFQKIQRLARYVKALGHSTREHNDFRAVIEQLLHVGDLNTGPVSSSCLPPIPFTGAAWEKLCILVRLSFALHLEPAPGNVGDPRRTIGAIHSSCHSERSEAAT